MNIFISFLALNLIIGVGVTKPIEPVSITTLIKENMDEFNLPQLNQGKRETNFKSVSNTFDVLNERGTLIGELIIFDNNDGYLFIGEGN